jgi:hypothetical protein
VREQRARQRFDDRMDLGSLDNREARPEATGKISPTSAKNFPKRPRARSKRPEILPRWVWRAAC